MRVTGVGCASAAAAASEIGLASNSGTAADVTERLAVRGLDLGDGRRRFDDDGRRPGFTRLNGLDRRGLLHGLGGRRGEVAGPAARLRRAAAARSPGAGSSASGTFHSNASSRPVTGDTGIQRSDTKPSAVQAGSRAARAARAPSIRARGRHRRAPSPRARPSASRPAASARRAGARGARGRRRIPAPRCAARANASAPSTLLPGASCASPAHAVEPLARGIAGPQMRIDVGQIGMRIARATRPRRCGRRAQCRRPRPSNVPASAAAGTRVGRELDGLERQPPWRRRDRSPASACASPVSSTARWRR